MEKSKVLFGEAESIMEQTRNPRLIEQQIKINGANDKNMKGKGVIKQSNMPSKKPNSFSK
jgi:hypothetical protein